jgi:glycosyltransferase involved in cell wall biosynthesis
LKTATESLSILLIVRNAQNRLAREVERLVETASELTDRFEVVIVDDGSTDATEEIAWELSARHEQVELVRQQRTLGQISALRAGLARTTGEYVLLSAGNGAPADEALSALWRQRHAVCGEDSSWQPAPAATGWLERLLRPLRGRGTATDSTSSTRGWRLLHRTDLAELAPARTGTGRSYLDRPRAPRASLAAPTADSRDAAWHNVMS